MTVPGVCKPEKSDEVEISYSQNGVSRAFSRKLMGNMLVLFHRVLVSE